MSWVIKVTLAPAKATIVKDARYTGVQINGQPVEPGTYTVHKGDTIYVYATVKNTGEQADHIWVWIRDKIRGDLVMAQKVEYVQPGDTTGISVTPVQVNDDVEIVIEAGVGPIPGQNKTDEWGC